MPLRLERADLLSALTAVARVVEARNTIPILGNVHLSFADDRLTVRGTDLDIEITTSVAASGELETTTAPAKTLLDIVKKFPAGAEVTLELDKETLLVKSGRSRFKLAVLGAGDFPSISEGAFGPAFEVDLRSLFKDSDFATNPSDARAFMSGVQLERHDGVARASASDGHRLARVSGAKVPEFASVNFPLKTIGVLPDGPVSLSITKNKVRIEFGVTTIVSKLIEMNYPDLDRLIPKTNDKAIDMDRGDLAAALDRVGTVSSERGGKSVKLIAGNGRVELRVTNPDSGEATDEVATTFDGSDVEIGFNIRYMTDILRAAGGERVTIHLNDNISPGVVTCDDPNKTFVIMPMRVA